MGYVSIEMAFEFDYWMINIIIRNDRVSYYETIHKYQMNE